MDTSAGDSSLEGVYEGNAPPSPSPAPRLAPNTPKDGIMSPNLAFRPPPRPGSSLRKGRKSDFNTPAPPPLPHSLASDLGPLTDTTNIDHGANAGSSSVDALAQGSSTPSRPSSSSSLGHASLYNFAPPSAEANQVVANSRTSRQKLQALREENQNQVNSAGLLGQGLLELRSRIESLMDELADELTLAEQNANKADDTNKRESATRIQQLSERIDAEIEEMEAQKQRLYREVMSHGVDVSTLADQTLSPADTESPTKASRVASAIKDLTGSTPGKASTPVTPSKAVPTPRTGDRRSRNAAARQARADSELINEIQAGLVQEVRRLQGLLKERDDQRTALERSNADLEKQLDQYKPRVIQMTETEDALKQENWDLNVAKQGLEDQLATSANALKKVELENMRLTKDLGKARETADAQRLQIDAHLAEIEKINKQRETEVAMARKERAGMQRDVSDLQSELQRFRAQQLNDRNNISRSVSNSYVQDEGQDHETDPDALAARLRATYAEAGMRSPSDSVHSDEFGTRSPFGNRLGRDKEAQDLRSKLAMAQKKAGKDAADKRRVREKNAELKKLLAKAGVKVPQGLDDSAESSEDEELQWVDTSAPNSPSVRRATRYRPAKSALRSSVVKRFGLPASESSESIIEHEEDAIAAEEDSEAGGSPRGSLDGMDPAFVDLNRGKSGLQKGRLATASSPLARTAVLAASDDGNDEPESPSQTRATSRLGGRRSAAGARPTSEIYEPSALGNELSALAEQADSSPAPYVNEDLLPVRSLEETGTMTDPLPDLVTPALAERDQQHAAAIEALKQSHTSFVEQRTAEHAKALAEAESAHQAAIKKIHEEHQEQITSRDRAHSATIATTLADRTKIHDAALAEARSRHSKALAEQVSTSSAALADAIAKHKAYVEEQELRHRGETERREASHTYALGQKDRQHREATVALEAAHAGILAEREASHKRALAASEAALKKAQAEIEKLKSAIAELEAKLKSVQQDAATAQGERDAQIEKLKAEGKDLESQLKSVQQDAATAQAERDAKIVQLKNQGSELESKLAASEQSSSKAQTEKDAEIVRVTNITKDLEDQLRKRNAAAEQAKSDHEAEVAKLRAGHGDLETKLRLTEQRASSVQSERDSASQEAIKRAYAEVEALKVASVALESKLKTTQSDLVLARDQGESESKRLTMSVQELKTKLEKAEEGSSALESQLKRAQNDLASARDQGEAETKRLASSVRELETKLQKAEQDTSALRSQKDKEASDLQSSLREVEAKLSSAEQRSVQLAENHKHEVAALNTKLNELKTQLASSQRDATGLQTARTAIEKDLASTRSALAEATANVKQLEEAEAQRKAKEAEAELGAETDAENFEDAVSHMVTPAMSRSATNKRGSSDSGSDGGAIPGTPADFELSTDHGIKRIKLADLKESGCQTDDMLWNGYQESLAPRPLSALTTSTRADSHAVDAAVGQGGVIVLGGHRPNRPRDSVSTFGGNRDGSLRLESPAPTMYTVGAVTNQQQSRRTSVDSTWSRQTDRASDIPAVPPLPDKTKPPVMSMPPPPAMPPPATLPAKRSAAVAAASSSSSTAPPPRPTSPPPTDLLARAQKSAHLQVPYGEQPRSVSRASARTAPPSAFTSSRARQQSSGGSVRVRTLSTETSGSAVLDGNSIYNGTPSGRKSAASRRSGAALSTRRGPRQSSAASFVSDVTSDISRRLSLASSLASDADAGDETYMAGHRDGRRAGGVSEFGASEGTDPAVIHAITQTMIGEYMHKYTRKSMGRGGHSDKRHRRYFWVHPYTKMLYWTISDPGGAKVSEGTSKSASIEGVTVVEDSNPSPPGLYHESLVITTATREVKITAPNRERHEAWLGALDYLVNRPALHDAETMTSEAIFGSENQPPQQSEGFFAQSLGRRSRSSAGRRPSLLGLDKTNLLMRKSSDNMTQIESTPRKRGGSMGASSVMYPSIGKRRDIPAREWLQQAERDRQISMSPTSSIRRGAATEVDMDADDSYDHLLDLHEPIKDARLQTAEEMLEEDEGEGFEGLANVRACCDGKHDVGSLDHTHHTHGRRSSRRHGRQSSGGLRSKLDGRVSPTIPQVPPLPLSLGRASQDSWGTGGWRGSRPSDWTATGTGAASSTAVAAAEGVPAKTEGRSVSQPSTVGPSYGERIQKIRRARQSGTGLR